MVVAARCLNEGLWGSAGASELPPTLQGEEGRKEVVSLGEWLAPSTSHYAAVLSGGGFRGSQRTLSISKQLGEGNREREEARLFLCQAAWFCWGFSLSSAFVLVSGPDSGGSFAAFRTAV